MEKCIFVGSLQETAKDLNQLIESLQDNSLLCYPNNYDCSRQIDGIIFRLRKIRKECKKMPTLTKEEIKDSISYHSSLMNKALY